MTPASLASRRPVRLLPLRLALRELRGGLRGFYVFIACIALGVMAIAGVGSFAASLADGLAREGRVILGGDLSFNLSQREASAAERAFLDTQGQVSAAATLRAMARTDDGRSTLIELKAVDGAYPLFGAVTLDPAGPLALALAPGDGAFAAAADPTLLIRLDLKSGARITVGSATFELRAVLQSEPDKLAGGIGFGPRLLMSDQALRATGLLQPGSQVRWHYRLRLPASDAGEAAVREVMRAAAARLPEAGWEIRTRSNASPSLEQNVERFTQYLTLVGLTALLVGGVGVANAVKGHLDRKRDTIATLKSLGATGRGVFAIYLTQAVLLACIGALPGLAVGAALPFLIAWGFGTLIPLPLAPALHLGNLALALLYGVMTALAFTLWPIGRAHDVSASALFRDEVARERRWPRRPYIVATVLVACALATLAVKLAFDQRIAAIFVVAAAAVLVALRLVAALVMTLARRLPRARSTVLRLAIANIHRPGSLTLSVVLSLGLGLALLVTVIEIDGNLRRQFLAALPEKAPSFFFLDIAAADAGRFDAFIRANAPRAVLDRVPMLRGRIVAANGVPAEELKPPPSAAWVLQSDRGITYADAVPAGSRVVEGEWWKPDDQGPALVSFEKKLADGLGLKLGDPVTVNVLGRNITARISNLRTLDWQSLGINFVMVFSPATFRGAPATHIATLTYPGGGSASEETALLKAVGDAFPSVTAVRVRDAIDAFGSIVTNLVLGIRAASGLTLLVAVLVLGGALAAGHRNRVYDAVVLKTLGATRGRLLMAYGLEYLLIGLATALFGVAAGSVAGGLVITQVMNLTFQWLPGPALAAAAVAVAGTVVLGLLGTYSVLGQRPAPVLRAL
ncbi:MAG: putative transport system permease protein [Alphaproteobacteria bacterium]|jgi:putative ABC transport system permease protein|nr:putative transport system permease protein [Alphaproteobacteria bacterium]